MMIIVVIVTIIIIRNIAWNWEEDLLRTYGVLWD